MRYSGTAENFQINLNKPINLSSDKTAFQAYITNVELPYAFHQINDTNNTFVVSLLVNNVVVNTNTASIPAGNYNILNLLTEVKTAIYTATGVGGISYNFSYNKNNGIITFGYNLIATSPLTVNVNPINQIFIRSDIVASNGDSESLENYNENSNILAKIPIRVQPSSYIFSTSNFDERVFLSVPQLTVINFYLTAGNSKSVLNNQSQEWSFVLTILEVEKPEQFNFTKVATFVAPMIDAEQLKQEKENLIKELSDLKTQLEKED